MGSCMNFENVASMALPEGKTTVSYPLARQGSIYSMTFDELQTVGSLGRDFGSINMEELVKNLWTVEENQTNATAGGGCNAPCPGGNLQRQGSLTLPRTISQKTVDDVWKDLLKESGGASKDETDGRCSNIFRREPTLGETTLEEFLVRAGVVREEIHPVEKPIDAGFYGGLAHTNGNNNGFTIDFQQPSTDEGMLSNQNMGNSTEFSFNLALNGNRVMSPKHQQHPQVQKQLQPLSPRQTTRPFASPLPACSGLTNSVVGIANSPLNSSKAIGHSEIKNMASSGMKDSIGMGNGSLSSPTAVAHSGLMNMSALHGVTITVPGGSPLNTIPKSGLDSPSLSSFPYAYTEGGQGRRSSASVEKQVERRRRRMIKNRESAARSRARKQAFIVQLEAEITKLKEANRELKEEQVELMNMLNNPEPESVHKGKRRRISRTLSGPW